MKLYTAFQNTSWKTRLKSFQLLVIQILLLVTLLTSFAQPPVTQASAPTYTDRAIPGELIVKLLPGMSIDVFNLLYGTEVVRQLDQNLFLLKSPAGAVLLDLLGLLSLDLRVLFVELNYEVSISSAHQIFLAFDQNSANLLGGGTSQALANARSQWAFDTIELQKAQRISDGKGVKVAVLDTGVYAHADLAEDLLPGYNWVDRNSNATDVNGHGTFVAGLVNQVAPATKILPVRVLDAEGKGKLSNVISGIIWATDNGAKVINLSMGLYYQSKALEQAVKYAQNRGVLVVASAGNESTNQVRYPAGYSNVVGVAATNVSNQKADFSNYGSYLKISSPGVNLYSNYWRGGYAKGDGTSFSTPLVAGTAALLWSEHPSWKAVNVSNEIYENTLRLNDTTYSGQLGRGLLDVYQALNDN